MSVIPLNPLESFLRVGLIQTTVDFEAAWIGSPVMSEVEQEHAWAEITTVFRAFSACEDRPHIILIPELAVPRGRRADLFRLAKALRAVVIAGYDYRIDAAKKRVFNEATVIVPSSWRKGTFSRWVKSICVGKSYAAPGEAKLLHKAGWQFVGDGDLWVLNADEFGTFGVCICYDLMDLERQLLYRGRVDHLMIVAYNRDLRSFEHIAEAASRMLFANVVICNTGYYGGSLAVAPYYDPWNRTLYRHDGAKLLGAQIISLPVASLRAARDDAPGDPTQPRFKEKPPGLRKAIDHQDRGESLSSVSSANSDKVKMTKT